MVTGKQLRAVEAWATSKYALAGMPSDPPYVTALTGDTAVMALATYGTSAGLGRAPRLASTSSPLTPADRWTIDNSRLNVVKYQFYRESASSIALTQLEYGVLFVDFAGAQVGSEFIMDTVKDMDAGQYLNSRVIVAPFGITSLVADVTAPSGATQMVGFVRDVGSSSFTLSAFISYKRLPLTTVPCLLDGFNGITAAYGSMRLFTDYDNPMFECTNPGTDAVRKFNATSAHKYVSDIWPWLAGEDATITKFCDAFGFRRHGAPASNPATLRQDGPVGAIGGRSLDYTISSPSGPAGSILSGVGDAGLIACFMFEDPRQYQGQGHVIFIADGLSAANARLELQFYPADHALDLPGAWTAAGKTLDANAVATGTVFPGAKCEYHVHAAYRKSSNGNLYQWLDDPAAGGLTQVDAALMATGNTSTTLSQKMNLLNFQGKLVFAAVRKAAWSDADITTICQRLALIAPMGTLTAATRAIWSTLRSWYSRDHAFYHNGVLYHCGSDRLDQQNITTWPGTRSVLSTTYAGVAYSDHTSPCPRLTSNNRLLVIWSLHGQEPKLRYRLSTDDTVANLGTELTINCGVGDSEYVERYQHGIKVLVWQQEDNNLWNLLRCLDDTAVTLTWEAAQPYIVDANNTLYQMVSQISADVFRVWSYITPVPGANSLKVHDYNASTNTASVLGSNVSLPINHVTLATTIVEVGTSNGIRLLDAFGLDCLYATWTHDASRAPLPPVDENTTATLYWLHCINPAAPHLPASYVSIYLTSLGKTYDAENRRWGSAIFSRSTQPGSQVVLYISRRLSDGTYVGEKWTSALGTGADWAVERRRHTSLSSTIIGHQISPIGNDGTHPDVIWNITDNYENLTNRNSWDEIDDGVAF